MDATDVVFVSRMDPGFLSSGAYFPTTTGPVSKQLVITSRAPGGESQTMALVSGQRNSQFRNWQLGDSMLTVLWTSLVTNRQLAAWRGAVWQ